LKTLVLSRLFISTHTLEPNVSAFIGDQALSQSIHTSSERPIHFFVMLANQSSPITIIGLSTVATVLFVTHVVVLYVAGAKFALLLVLSSPVCVVEFIELLSP
jgi:hypothetical protein